jgi:hypothetical protein
MAPAVAFPPPMRSLSTIAPEIVGRATCPLCHTVDPTMTNIALSAGADWHCSRCGQRWDTIRLAAVVGYAVWLSARTEGVRQSRGARPPTRSAGGSGNWVTKRAAARVRGGRAW